MTDKYDDASKKLITSDSQLKADRSLHDAKLQELEKKLHDYNKQETVTSTSYQKSIREMEDKLNQTRNQL